MNSIVRRLAVLSLFVLASALSARAFAAPDAVLPEGEWSLVTLPGDPGASATLGTVFDDALGSEDYDRTWIAYEPVVETGSVRRMDADDALVPGQGLWIRHSNARDVTVSMSASATSVLPEVERGCPSVRGCLGQTLQRESTGPYTWNVLALPIESPVAVSDVRVVTDSGSCASGCDIGQAIAASVLADSVWRWTGNDAGYERLSGDDPFFPWEALWLPVLQDARLLAAPPSVQPKLPVMSDYEMVFEEDFDGPTLDPAKWNTGLLWGPFIVINNEEQLYIDSLGMHANETYDPFVFDNDGERSTMTIKASAVGPGAPVPEMPAVDDEVWGQYLEYRPDPNHDPDAVNYLSGIITTYESFRFTHGYVEASVRLPVGKGLWPAFWALPIHYVDIVPEIDVMEALMDDRNLVYHTYHYFDRSDQSSWVAKRTPSYQTIGPDFSADFHTFGMAWDPNQIIYYVDGIEVRRVRATDSPAPGEPPYELPKQAMYLIANLAVGGNWPGAPDANTPFPAEYELDYIRAYRKKVSTPVDLSDYQLVFEDNFDGQALDTTKWATRYPFGPFRPPRNEQQYYVDPRDFDAGGGYSPFGVAAGELTVRAAEADSESNPVPSQPPEGAPIWSVFSNATWNPGYTDREYTSGVLTTYDSFDFVNGYVEIRATLPAGQGIWPGFRLRNAYGVGRLPEIDIVEYDGRVPDEVRHGYSRLNANGLRSTTTAESPLSDGDAHVYGLQWERDRLVWYVDGQVTHTETIDDAPYQLMYLVLKLALGGDPASRALGVTTVDVDPLALPAEMKVDYVRVYQGLDSP